MTRPPGEISSLNILICFLRKYASYTSSSNMHEWRNINTKNDIKGVLLFLAHPYSNYRDVKRGLLSSFMRMLHILISYLYLKRNLYSVLMYCEIGKRNLKFLNYHKVGVVCLYFIYCDSKSIKNIN